MILIDGIWKVYNIVVENVSLVLNYRDPFREILANHTPAQMLEILKKKWKNDRLQEQDRKISLLV